MDAQKIPEEHCLVYWKVYWKAETKYEKPSQTL